MIRRPGDGYYRAVTTGVQLCTTGKSADRVWLGAAVVASAGTAGTHAVYDGTSTAGTLLWSAPSTATAGTFSGDLQFPAYTGLYAVAATGGTLNVKYGDGDG